MTEPKRYRKLPVEITAIELTQYGDFVRAAQWINDNGGSAVFSPKLGADGHDYLIITTLESNAFEAPAGWFVIQGVKGEFYACEPEIFSLTYEAVEVPEYDSMSGTGSYVVGRPDGRTSLVGGAAISIPII